MLQVLQKFQFSVCSLGQNRGAKGLHDLLNRNILPGEVNLCRTSPWYQHRPYILAEQIFSPDQTKRAHANRLEIRIPGRKSVSSSQTSGLHPAWPRIPGCNLEGRAEDLCSYEFRHVDELLS